MLPNGGIMYKGNLLDPERVSRLQEDAEKFAESVIWKLLSDDARHNANVAMYERSTDYEGMMFGKAVLYAIDIINQRLQQLKVIK